MKSDCPFTQYWKLMVAITNDCAQMGNQCSGAQAVIVSELGIGAANETQLYPLYYEEGIWYGHKLVCVSELKPWPQLRPQILSKNTSSPEYKL